MPETTQTAYTATVLERHRGRDGSVGATTYRVTPPDELGVAAFDVTVDHHWGTIGATRQAGSRPFTAEELDASERAIAAFEEASRG